MSPTPQEPCSLAIPLTPLACANLNSSSSGCFETGCQAHFMMTRSGISGTTNDPSSEILSAPYTTVPRPYSEEPEYMMSVSWYLSPSTSTSWSSMLDHDSRNDPFGFAKNDSYPSLALLATDIRMMEATTFKLSFMRSRGIVEMEPARSKYQNWRSVP